MAIKFKPTVFNESDLRAYKFVGSSAVAEGQFVSVASTDLNTLNVTAFSGTSPARGTQVNTSIFPTTFNTGQYFVIYREDPDIENVSATINQNDFVIGFQMKSGNEFELDVASTERVNATAWDVMALAAIGSNGLLTPAGATFATGLVVAECLGTFNSKWARFRVL